MRILEQTTVAYRRLPAPLALLAALLLIPLGLILGLVILVPAVLIMLIARVWISARRLLGRAMSAARIDGQGRRNVRVIERGSTDPFASER